MTKRKVKHLLADPEKTSTFYTDAEFVEFAKLIVNENDDSAEFIIENAGQAENYIKVYCDNLQLV
jgi:hypothetical protein